MDFYGLPQPELFRVDDLLDFSNGDIFSPNSSTTDSDHTFHHQHLPLSDITSTTTTTGSHFNDPNPNFSTDDLIVPSDEVAELEWLSNFVDDSFTDTPANSFADDIAAFQVQSRSKRCRSSCLSSSSTKSNGTRRRESSVEMPRRCTHCASEKTPQWRTGPMGPKTLCNACGVRFKSGRLVPEYRPAASPTFVLTQHSNSHRKVLELRRQKDLLHLHHHQQHQQAQVQQQHMYGRHHFQVC